MTVEEKKALREQKLKELYDFNENNPGREAGVKFTDLQGNEEDKKEYLAYEYLQEKGLISFKIMGGRNLYTAKINVRGIDYVEENLVK